MPDLDSGHYFLTTLALRRPIVIESIETAKEDIVFKSPLRLAS